MTAGCAMGAGRREFLRRVALVSASVPASLLTAGGLTAAQVTIPSEFDTSLESIAVAFRGASGMTLGYLSQPKAGGPRPGLVVVHDVAGLTPGIRGVSRNAATSGYTVVAPDLLSPQGGTAGFRGVEAEVQRAVNATSATAVAAQLTAALGYAKSHGSPGGNGSGLLGFGWGATQALLFAAGRAEIAACVAFYPDPQQTLPALAKITGSALAIFAEDDPATKDGVQQFEQAAKSGRRPHVVRVFPGLMRGFHDPAEAKIYRPDAAKEVWTLAIQHLDAHTREKTKGEAIPEGGK
jgi:carboxymethylenebutenolidase